MAARIKYGEIAQEERMRLAGEIMSKPKFRVMDWTIFAMIFVISFIVAYYIGEVVVWKEKVVMPIVTAVVLTGCGTWLVNLVISMTWLRRVVEKAKNSSK